MKPSKSRQSTTDFVQVVSGAIVNIPFKVMFFVFLLALLLSTDVYTTQVLSGISGAVSNGAPTETGFFINAAITGLATGAVIMLA